MQPIPTYEDLPVVFDTAPQVEIPVPTIDSGYGEGVALPTEHFSWLEYKITKKIDELAGTVTSLITEMDNYLTSRSVTPNGTAYNQFLTALAAQIAGASVASAAACTGNSATATSAGQCTGNSSTATNLATPRTITISGDATGSTSFDGSRNVTISLDVTSANTSQSCSGNSASIQNNVVPGNGIINPASASDWGKFLYLTGSSELYYCAKRASDYWWISIN